MGIFLSPFLLLLGLEQLVLGLCFYFIVIMFEEELWDVVESLLSLLITRCVLFATCLILCGRLLDFLA